MQDVGLSPYFRIEHNKLNNLIKYEWNFHFLILLLRFFDVAWSLLSERNVKNVYAMALVIEISENVNY